MGNSCKKISLKLRCRGKSDIDDLATEDLVGLAERFLRFFEEEGNVPYEEAREKCKRKDKRAIKYTCESVSDDDEDHELTPTELALDSTRMHSVYDRFSTNTLMDIATDIIRRPDNQSVSMRDIEAGMGMFRYINRENLIRYGRETAPPDRGGDGRSSLNDID